MADQQHNGLWIGFWLPPDIAEQLAIDGGEEPTDMHMTVLYIPDVAEEDIQHATRVVEQFAKEYSPLAGWLSGVGRFYASQTSGGMDVIYESFDGPGLPAFRQELVRRLNDVGVQPSTAHGYSPHITLAYVDSETDATLSHEETIPVTFTSLQMRVNDEVTADFELSAQGPPQPVGKRVEWNVPVEIHKVDDDQQLVFGWLSVSQDEQGNVIVDAHDDIITPEDLEQMAYDFVLYARVAGEMHVNIGVGRLVESMMFTQQKIEALGIPEGILPIGWWVGFKIDDPNVWAKVKSGEYAAFSFGGYAYREEVA